MENMMTKQVHVKAQSPLFAALLLSLEPLMNALDTNPFRFTSRENDPGHERNSTNDQGIRITLDVMLRWCYTQLYQQGRVSSNGVKINNVKEMMDRSQQTLQNLIFEKYKGDTERANDDPEVARAFHWLEVNQARFNFLHDIYDAYMSCYQHVTGEQWKYTEFQRQEPKTITTDKARMSAALAAFAETAKPTLIKKGSAEHQKLSA